MPLTSQAYGVLKERVNEVETTNKICSKSCGRNLIYEKMTFFAC